MLAMGKHYSLLQTFSNYRRKKFCNIVPRALEISMKWDPSQKNKSEKDKKTAKKVTTIEERALDTNAGKQPS